MIDKNQNSHVQDVNYPVGQVPVGQVPAGYYENEVDLKELVLALIAEKWLIFGVASVCTVIALVYALLSTPYYKSEAKIRPIPDGYLEAINNSKIIELKGIELFEDTYAALDSRSLQYAYFIANKDAFSVYFDGVSEGQAFASFLSDGFQLTLPSPEGEEGKGYFISLEYTAPEGVDGAAALDGYLSFIAQKLKGEIIDRYDFAKASALSQLEAEYTGMGVSLEQEVGVEIAIFAEADAIKMKELEDKKSAVLKELVQIRRNRISELGEALILANKLGIEDAVTMPSFAAQVKTNSGSVNVPADESVVSGSSKQGESVAGTANSRSLQRDSVAPEVSVRSQPPLYSLGSRVISAQIEVLKARQNDSIGDLRIADIDRQLSELSQNRRIDALKQRVGNEDFYRGIDSLKTERARLAGLSLSSDTLNVFNVSDAAYTNPVKVKPRRSLIVVIGLLLGVFLGAVIVFFKRAFK